MEFTHSAAQLHTYVMEGLLGDIVQAREAYALLRVMGENSDALVAPRYGYLFGALDRSLVNHYILAIARLFDRPSDRFEIRSIPSALRIMKGNVAEFPIRERPSLEQRLGHAGIPQHELAQLADVDLTLRLIAFFEARMPSTDDTATDALSMALRAVRTRRDKRVAHSEHAPGEVFPQVTWTEAESLVRYAEDFLSCVSFGYLSLALTDDSGYFMLGADASRPARALERLLKAAAINEPAPAA